MARIVIKVNDERLRLFNSFSFTGQIDSIASGVSFSSFENISTFDYAKIEVLRNDVLIFTGEIVEKEIPNELKPKPFTYKALSTPHILSECTLPTESYPLQLSNSTLKDIVDYICGFFEVTAIFDQSAESEASSEYKLSDLGIGKTAFELINDLVTQDGLILAHNAFGELLITKSIVQNEVLLPKYQSNNKKFDLKKFYYNYIALGQAPVGEDADIQAIARFDNIDTRRNTTKIQDSGGIASIENKASGMRLDSLKSINQGLTFNNFFCNVGDYVVINDLKLVINRLNYSYNEKVENASISLLDSQIYER